ncbi:MAG TPA: peptidoglycan recognition family protein, partial [Kofleriaceae bacterium]|nr:peptidoglycan recognition family protein [Kofleriaceae bacterium]
MVRPNGNLIIGGQRFNVDAPVVNWTENGWDATKPFCIPTPQEPAPGCPGGFPHGPPPVTYVKRYATRPGLPESKLSYNAVRAIVKQFVVHHDGCANAEMCFDVLQNERGLSVHFLLDNDGTIYQTIDLGLMAYHAAEWNLYSIGVELCNRGDALKEPNYYKRTDPNRGTQLCKINGNTFKAFRYTDAQNDAFFRLCRELVKLLPNLATDYPQSSPGEQMWNTLPNAISEREHYTGYIGHYHLTQQKWDPGPFDFKDFCTRLRGALCFPMFPRLEAKQPDEKPVVPDDAGDLKQAAKELYKLNEERADGGFFPVGPWGESRLWHGGIHVIGKPEGGVFSPYPGRLVAARMGRDSAIGSFNFVLIRHELSLGKSKLQLYSLFMHLADELKRDKPVDWMTKDAWKAKGKAGSVVLLDEPIEAGALIGHVGKVGPDELSRSQVHLEFFADRFLEGFGDQWTLVDGSAGGRFCEAPEINDLIDQNKDGMLSRKELAEFFTNGSGEQLRRMVTLHVSEWAFEPSWSEALKVPKDFKSSKKSAEIDAMVADQITPGLWWDAAVATHCRLPKDAVVYHYHPIAFITWYKNQLIEAAALADKNRQALDDKDARKVPPSITDDRSGAAMLSTADITEDPCNNLTL